MRSGRNRPAMKMLLEARRPQDELPGLYERLGFLMRKRGEAEAEMRALKSKEECTKEVKDTLHRLDGELGRIREEVAGIDGEIKAIERRRKIKKPEDATE